MSKAIAKIKDAYTSPHAEILDRKCKKARETGRIILDCFHTTVFGDRVTCRLGCPLHHTSKDGSVALIAVLKGHKVAICKECPSYDDKDES